MKEDDTDALRLTVQQMRRKEKKRRGGNYFPSTWSNIRCVQFIERVPRL